MIRKRRFKDDCLRRCVAIVTGRSTRRVPHFVRRARGRWIYDLRRWCDRTRFNVVVSYNRPSDHLSWNVRLSTGVILVGPSYHAPRRDRPLWHAIVVDPKTGETIYDGGNKLRSVRGHILIWPR